MANQKKKKRDSYPICELCGTRYSLKDYYGKEKTPRYECRNKACEKYKKSVSSKVLKRIEKNKLNAQQLYVLFLKHWVEEENRKKTMSKLEVSRVAVEKFVKEITLEKDEIKKDWKLPTINISTQDLKLLAEFFDPKYQLPLICLVPTNNNTLFCCIADPYRESVVNPDVQELFSDKAPAQLIALLKNSTNKDRLQETRNGQYSKLANYMLGVKRRNYYTEWQ